MVTSQQRIHQIDVRLSEIDRVFQSHTNTDIPIDQAKFIGFRNEALKLITERALLHKKGKVVKLNKAL